MQSAPPRPHAFSLVELLVVIGIIGLLLALLFPAMGAARAHAESLQCQATLRTIGTGCFLHANDHRGHLPIAGLHWDVHLEPPGPVGLNDPIARRYTYYREDDIDRPAPFSVAVGLSLGVSVRLDSRESMEEDMQKEELRKRFRCPSHVDPKPGLTNSIGGWHSPFEWSSYVVNDAITGTGKRMPEHVCGKLDKIRRPSAVMLVMDGRRRYPDGETLNWLTLPPTREFNGNRSTLADYRRASLDPAFDFLGRQALDYLRHSWKANVLFVDGHVETIRLTEEGCRPVGILNGVYD